MLLSIKLARLGISPIKSRTILTNPAAFLVGASRQRQLLSPTFHILHRKRLTMHDRTAVVAAACSRTLSKCQPQKPWQGRSHKGLVNLLPFLAYKSPCRGLGNWIAQPDDQGCTCAPRRAGSKARSATLLRLRWLVMPLPVRDR
jgi:hypothetical protein